MRRVRRVRDSQITALFLVISVSVIGEQVQIAVVLTEY